MAALSGMKEITQYMGRSESTILALIRHHEFPARKILGVWESHRDLIENWRLEQLGAQPLTEGKTKGGRGAVKTTNNNRGPKGPPPAPKGQGKSNQAAKAG